MQSNYNMVKADQGSAHEANILNYYRMNNAIGLN